MNDNRKKNKQKETASKCEWKDYIGRQHIAAFLAAILWGLAAHSYMFFNKLCWHDDMSALFGTGTTYPSGRWFLGVLGETVQKLFGNVSLPWFNGLVSLLFLAAGSVLLTEIFQLKRTVSCILLGGLLTVFPSWTATYAYMFTSAYYACAAFLALLGIACVWKVRRRWCGILLGAVCICLSLGIYQAYLPLAATVLLIAFLNDVIAKPENSFREHFVKGISGVVTLLLGIVFYFITNQVFLSVKHIELTEYKNINHMGQTDIGMMLNGIVSAWREFLVPAKGTGADMYMQSARNVYYAILILTVLCIIWHMVQCWKKNRITIFFLLGGTLCFPIGINLLYLMGDISGIHALMLYAKVMVFVLPIVLVERIEADLWNIKKFATLLLSILLVYVGIFYTHYANACYLQAEFQQKEVISWLNTLVTRIQSQDGYERGLPIVYLNGEGQGGGVPAATTTLMELPGVETSQYVYESFSGWKTGLFRWCGFKHEEITDTSEIASWPEVQKMPSYPKAGSVQIIRGVIVVKFQE